MLGIRYDTIPIPPVAEHTQTFEAGAVTILLEYRHLDDSILDEAFAGDERQAAIINDARPDTLQDEGFSLHVNDAATGDEYLRFDVFDSGPHYHYIYPGEYNLSIDFDVTACGDMWEWAVGCIRDRLPEMLRYASADALADRVDPVIVATALDRVVEARDRASRDTLTATA